MSSTYKQFLASPSSSLLAANATLHYITTTTSYHGPTDIIKHLSMQRNQVRTKKEEILELVEGATSLAAEVDTTLEFVTSGGAYLPGLDDNFLSDRTVYLPVMHFVALDADGKIVQIRLTWDQGSLLKQLDIIGRTGRNWPIRDSREQLRLIATSLKAAGKAGTNAGQEPQDAINRSRGNSTNVLRDPHASLALFAPREEIEQSTAASVVSPYAGTRPRQRSFAEILGDEAADENITASPSKGRERSMSPSKAVAPKAGSGKNFQPIRLFEGHEVPDSPDTPEKARQADRFYRPNPKKYQHFDFADGSEPQDAPKAGMAHDARPKSKHDSTWGFEDFMTPQKATAPTRVLRHHQSHFDGEGGVQETPGQKPGTAAAAAADRKPRRDAETHFEFRDDGVPAGEPRLVGRPKGTAHNTGLGLYENNLYSEDGSAPPADARARALGNITNLKDRRKDFDAHFQMTDASPSQQAHPSGAAAPPAAGARVSEDRMKAVKMMDANWATYDESPASQKENKPLNGGSAAPTADQDSNERGIHIGGDGMGGPRGSDRGWMFGEDKDATPRAIPGKKQGAAHAKENLWDF